VNTAVKKRVIDLVCLFFVLILPLLTLIFKFAEGVLKLVIIKSGPILANALFLFSCVVGVVTWREGRHISLASLTSRLPQKAAGTVAVVQHFTVPLVFTVLFFLSFSQMFASFDKNQTVLGIPLIVIFAALPLSYLAMLALFCRAPEHRAAAGLGIAGGLFLASGPIAGVLYSIFGAAPAFLDTWFALWCAIAGKATLPLVLALIALAFLGVPLFIDMSAISYIAFSQGGGYVEILSLEAYNNFTDKTVAAIPLFTIAGYVLSHGSAGNRLVAVFQSLFGWFRGGVVVATVIVTAFFTTFTGVSGTTILALGPLLVVILTGSGYAKDKAHALITSSGALGLLFPPSMAIIMYGTTNYFSVDVMQLFMGALIPGVLLSLSMISLGIFYDTKKDRSRFSLVQAGGAAKNAAFELLLPVFICLGFFTGTFSLNESAAFAVIYAVCLETFVRKDFTLKRMGAVIIESLPVSGGVLFILAAARGLSYFLLDANIPARVSELVLTFVSSKYVFLILLNGVLFLVGCLMDAFSAIMIVSPLIIPIAEAFALSPVHMGVIFLMNMQIGFLTPPVGMDLFIASYTFNVPVFKVVRGILPFLVIQVVILFLVTYVPWFSTALL
jgi:tripartite ATP-independent transporter DctM subunit